MIGPVFDGDVFWACEVALEVNNFQILNIQMKEVSLLLVDYGKLFSNFDSWKQLSDLLFV